MSDDSQSTPEFAQECRDIVSRWTRGELPFRDAIAILKKYSEEAKAANHRGNQIRVENALGYVQGYRGNLTVSIEHYDRARFLQMQVGNKHGVMVSDLNRGVNYRLKGDFNRAIKLFQSVQEQAKELDAADVCAMAMSNESLVHIRQNHLDRASDTLQKLMALSSEHYSNEDRNWPMIMCEAYYGLVMIYIEQKELEAAWAAAHEAWQIAATINQPVHKGYANRTVALVMDMLEETPDPEFELEPDLYYAQSARLFRDIKVESELAITVYLHAMSLGRRGRRTTAARKLQQALVIFTRLGMVDDAARTAEAQLAMI